MKLFNLLTDKSQENSAISGGRSMVEMIGVLAIIGVLSVGAISGYNTAMYKYRMNKTVQAVTDVMQNFIELSTKDWGNLEIWSSEQFVKYGLLPASMCPEGYADIDGSRGQSCKLPVGEISMDFTKTPYLFGEFYVRFFEGDIVKSCVDFLSHGWQNMYPQDWLRTDEDYSGSFIYVAGRGNSGQALWAVKPEVFQGAKKDNITLSDIQNACNDCKGAEYCGIEMVIYHEL